MFKKILSFIYRKSEEHFSGKGLDPHGSITSIANYMKSYLKSDYVETEGHKFFLDSTDALRLSINKTYETFWLDIAKNEIDEGNNVVELGSHIGYFTLNFAKFVGSTGHVFAFEPDPENFEILKKNIVINGYQNITAEKKAVLDKSKKIKLYLSKKNKGDHRVYASENNIESLEIEAVSLDEYFKNKNQIDFIWITIQGAEIAAFEGMLNIIKNQKNLKIITDFNPSLIKKFGREPKEYLEMILKNNFKIYNLDRRKKKVYPTEIESILKMATITKQSSTHLLCKHI